MTPDRNNDRFGWRTFKIRNRTNFFDNRWWWLVDLQCADAPKQGATLIVARCMRKYGWDEAFCRRVLAGYKQFLTLKKEMEDWDEQELSPCHYVDLMWVEHLSDLNNYLHDCLLLCDRVVDRNPDLHLDQEGKHRRDMLTREALKKRFGDKSYDDELWWNRVNPSSHSVPLADLMTCSSNSAGSSHNASSRKQSRDMFPRFSSIMCFKPQVKAWAMQGSIWLQIISFSHQKLLVLLFRTSAAI